MRFSRWLCALLLTGITVAAFAGDIQVSCEPALRVFLDGRLAGSSTAKEDGLFLAAVPKGGHLIRVEKAGFVAQSFRVEVSDLPIEVKVAEFTPETPGRREPDRQGSAAGVKQPAGTLVVTSAPQNCTVEIDGKVESKNVPVLRIEELTGGEHRVSFRKPGYGPISGVVTVQAGAQVQVRGDLEAGKVETVNEGEGSLRLTSTPEYCTVHFLGMRKEKTGTILNISHVPAGEHRIVVVWKGLTLASNVVIAKGRRTVVAVSFLKREEPFAVSSEPE